MSVAAIGSESGMEKYGLKILDRDIQDNENNFTVFIYVTRRQSKLFSLLLLT